MEGLRGLRRRKTEAEAEIESVTYVRKLHY
jgi:hypothetical protein